MSYVKTVWKTGDVITAEKLNNMESGIGAFYATFTSEADAWSCDKTIAEIYAAYQAGRPCFCVVIPSDDFHWIGTLAHCEEEGSIFTVYEDNGTSAGIVVFSYFDGYDITSEKHTFAS